MRLLMTGVNGYFGRVLLPAIAADPRLERLVVTDVGPGLPDRHADVDYRPLDLATADDAAIDGLLAGVDTVLHLAFLMLPKPGDQTDAINRAGQERLLRHATRRCQRLVVASAAAAYGFRTGHDPITGRIDESMPLTDTFAVPYATQKQALERLLDSLEASSDGTIVRLRPTNVGGPSMDPARSRHLTGPVQVAPRCRHPLRQQLLHESDLATAVVTALTAPAGAYNLAPDDWITLPEVADLLGQRFVALPKWLLHPLANWAWRKGDSPFDATWLAFLEHPPLILANDKLKALGWKPRFTTRQALQSLPLPPGRRAAPPAAP